MFTGAIDMYPRRAKQKLTNVYWDAVFEGIRKSGWSSTEVAEVTGIPHKSVQMMSAGKIHIPDEFKQAVALLDLYLMATHETNLPTL